MVKTISQAQILINQFNNLSINQQVHIASPVVNYVLRKYEGNLNPGDPQGIKLYLQATKEIYKESDKLDISVFNAKDIIYHFLSKANKYGWRRLESMIETFSVTKNVFRQEEHIQISDMHHHAHG